MRFVDCTRGTSGSSIDERKRTSYEITIRLWQFANRKDNISLTPLPPLPPRSCVRMKSYCRAILFTREVAVRIFSSRANSRFDGEMTFRAKFIRDISEKSFLLKTLASNGCAGVSLINYYRGGVLIIMRFKFCLIIINFLITGWRKRSSAREREDKQSRRGVRGFVTSPSQCVRRITMISSPRN